MRNILYCILFAIFLITCNSDDNEILVTTADFDLQLDENPNNNVILGIIEGTTNEGEVQFSLEEETPSGAFLVNEITGELIVADASHFDYEVNPVLTGIVKVYNGDVFALSSIEVTLNDIDETVIIVEANNFEITIDENPVNNQILGIIDGTTNEGEVQFSLEEETPSGAFLVNENRGELIVGDASLFDFEINPVLTGVVKVYYEDTFALATVVVTLTDLEEIAVTVEATDFEISVNEDLPNNEVLGVVQAVTNQGELTYSIQEQYPENAFSINEDSGELKVSKFELFDYETYPIISGIVNISNGDVSTNATVTINLLDVDYNNILFKSQVSTMISDINITDQNLLWQYENNELTRLYQWHGGEDSVGYGSMRLIETNNNLITKFWVSQVQVTSACGGEYTFTYDNMNRITNVAINDLNACGGYIGNYNIEYNGNIVNFIDQIDSDHRTIELNDNNQIVSYINGSIIFDFVYDGDNLISISQGNTSITYEYDNFLNPFKMDEILNLSQVQTFVDVLNFSYTYSHAYNNIFNNSNNMTRQVRTNVLNYPGETIYTYEYNAENYPIKRDMSSSDESVEYYYYD